MSRPSPGGIEQAAALESELLASQRQFLRLIIDLNPGFIFAKDRAGRFTLVNQAVADAYGTTVEDLIGRTDADFNPNAAEVAHFREDDLQVMDTLCEKIIPEERITDAAGQVRYLQTIKRPIVGPDGVANQVLGVSTDITARKRAEDQLAQAQKMEAIGRLAGGVAHDFNNLLTVILGSCEIVSAGMGPGHPLQSTTEEIRKAAERASMLTRQLLAFGRKQLLQARVLDVNQVLADAVRMLRHLIGEDVEIVTRFEAERAHVRADPVQITQVILNLAINARDAMPGGGQLVLGTRRAVLGAPGPEAPGAAPGEYVVVSVADTGCGIAADLVPHVFEPFFTTKPPGLGTGLGLATSYGIVQQSGGTITLDSEVGRGTVVHVYLPFADEEVGAAATRARDPGPGGRETLLLVEDESGVRRVAADALRSRGYRVLEAENGEHALDVAAAHAGPIDLLVSDVVMPRLGGLELASRLARVRPGTRVLFTSGYVETTQALRASLRAGVAFLAKPYLPDEITRRVREVLDRRT